MRNILFTLILFASGFIQAQTFDLDNCLLSEITITVENNNVSSKSVTSKTGTSNFFELTVLGSAARAFRITTQGHPGNAIIFVDGLPIESSEHGVFSTLATPQFEIIALNRGTNDFVLWFIDDGNFEIADATFGDLNIELDDPADEIISSVVSSTIGGEVISTVNNGEPTVTLTTAGHDVEFVTQTTVQETTISYSERTLVTTTTYSIKVNGEEDDPAPEVPETTVETEIVPANEQPGTAVVTIDLEFPNPDYMTPATLEELFAEANPGFTWNDDESSISHEGTDRVIYADIDPLNPQEIVLASFNVWLREDITLAEALNLLTFDIDVLNYASTTNNGAFVGSFQNIDPYRRFIRIKYVTDSDEAPGALGAIVEGNLDATKAVIDGLINQLIIASNDGLQNENFDFRLETYYLNNDLTSGETATYESSSSDATLTITRSGVRGARLWTAATTIDGVNHTGETRSTKQEAVDSLAEAVSNAAQAALPDSVIETVIYGDYEITVTDGEVGDDGIYNLVTDQEDFPGWTGGTLAQAKAFIDSL